MNLSVLGLASIHPVDDAYVGGPYLDRGLGGVGPGVAVMFDLVAATGPTLVVEFSAASVEVFQTGRLVGGQDTGAGGASGRLRDPMLSILGGFTFGRATTTTVVARPRVRGRNVYAGAAALLRSFRFVNGVRDP